MCILCTCILLNMYFTEHSQMSKEELQEKLNEQKLSERINLSMSMIDLNSSFSPVSH